MRHLLDYFSPHQIAFQVLAIVTVVFHLIKWDFVSKMLSENNVPSTKRVIAYIATLTICMCELYHTIKGEELEYQHLVAFLVSILLLLGIATVPQIIELWKGKAGDNKPASDAAPIDTKLNAD